MLKGVRKFVTGEHSIASLKEVRKFVTGEHRNVSLKEVRKFVTGNIGMFRYHSNILLKKVNKIHQLYNS